MILPQDLCSNVCIFSKRMELISDILIRISVGVVNFNGYYSCQKCTVRGKYYKKFKVMAFPNIECARRTNDSFRGRDQEEHHKEFRSLIEELLGVDMVNDFITSDSLHLIHHGVGKRCLTRWKNGTKSYKNKLSTVDLNRINLLLVQLNRQKPTEIHRAIRDLSVLHFWKATEFRTFVLYVGIVVLKDIVPLEEYEHFKLLCCAVKLCSTEVYEDLVRNTRLVDLMIENYINQYIDIYGEHTITSNVHNLCHLPDEVRRFGNLESISTYPFENCLYTIKLKLRAMAKPLEQISRRMSELSFLNNYESDVQLNNNNNDSFPQLKFPTKNDESKFQTVIFADYRLSSKKFGDKWFMDKNRRIIKFKFASVTANEQISLHGYEIVNKDNFFEQPFSSSNIDIYETSNSNSDEQIEVTIKIEDLKCKMLCFSLESKYIFQPLLHTLR